MGLTVSYPYLLSERTPETLVATLRRHGRTIDPAFRDQAKDDALPAECLKLIFHVRAPAGATLSATYGGSTSVRVSGDLVVTEFDRGCIPTKDPDLASFAREHAPELLMDSLNRGYGFDPVDFAHRLQKGFAKMAGTDAVAYDVAGHPVIAGVTQVTPNQSVRPGQKPPPPLETDIRTITALHAIFEVRGHLLIVSSMAGPYAAIPAAMGILVSFDGADPKPLFGFAITDLNPVTGEGIDLGPSR